MKNIYSLGAIVLVVALLWFFGSVNRTNPKTTSNLPKSDLASPLVAGENLFLILETFQWAPAMCLMYLKS